MSRRFGLFFIIFFLTAKLLHADNYYDSIAVYDEISDIYNPTIDDYRKIQDYITNGERSIIKHLQDYQPNARNFKLIGNSPDEMPQFGDIAVNCSPEEKENCLIVYSSFNKNYTRGLKRLVDFIKNSDFVGHILYRIGGWPNVEGGSLVLAHVPYAFKVSFFKEAQRLGYKRAFWLDTSILPLVSLNTIFQVIEADGYFVMGNTHNIGPYMTRPAIDAFGMTLEETNNIPSVSAGIFGVDFTSSIGTEIIDRWYRAAENKVAFFSPRSDQNALSIILYNMGIDNFISIQRLAHNKNAIKPDSLLLIEREFVNELSMGK